MPTRESLLEVTARLYAEHGWRGTTTRRIAEAAGINEVTIFRQFGSKEALLVEAIEAASREDGDPTLPLTPDNLRAELGVWALAHHRSISTKRGIIRACLAEWEERPALAPVACSGAVSAFSDLVRYLSAARRVGKLGTEGSLEAATVMLMNAIFMDAMTRDVMPGSHPHSVDQALSLFVDLTLRSLSAQEAA